MSTGQNYSVALFTYYFLWYYHNRCPLFNNKNTLLSIWLVKLLILFYKVYLEIYIHEGFIITPFIYNQPVFLYVLVDTNQVDTK